MALYIQTPIKKKTRDDLLSNKTLLVFTADLINKQHKQIVKIENLIAFKMYYVR